MTMTEGRRERTYLRQNRSPRLTFRQLRRLRHKQHKALGTALNRSVPHPVT